MDKQKVLTPEHVLRFKNVTDAQLSPDGELVAFVVGDSNVIDTRVPLFIPRKLPGIFGYFFSVQSATL